MSASRSEVRRPASTPRPASSRRSSTWSGGPPTRGATRSLKARSGIDLERAASVLLSRVDELGPARLSDVAAAAGVEISTASRPVARLVEQGYVERSTDPADGRACLLRCTPAGRDGDATVARRVPTSGCATSSTSSTRTSGRRSPSCSTGSSPGSSRPSRVVDHETRGRPRPPGGADTVNRCAIVWLRCQADRAPS